MRRRCRPLGAPGTASGVRATGDWGNSQAGRSFERPPAATLAHPAVARSTSGPAVVRLTARRPSPPDGWSSGEILRCLPRQHAGDEPPHPLRPVRPRPTGWIRSCQRRVGVSGPWTLPADPAGVMSSCGVIHDRNGLEILTSAECIRLLSTVRVGRLGLSMGEDGESGWSVLVQRRATMIADPAELARARSLNLGPWVGGPKDNYIKISGRLISSLSGPSGGPAGMMSTVADHSRQEPA